MMTRLALTVLGAAFCFGGACDTSTQTSETRVVDDGHSRVAVLDDQSQTSPSDDPWPTSVSLDDVDSIIIDGKKYVRVDPDPTPTSAVHITISGKHYLQFHYSDGSIRCLELEADGVGSNASEAVTECPDIFLSRWSDNAGPRDPADGKDAVKPLDRASRKAEALLKRVLAQAGVPLDTRSILGAFQLDPDVDDEGMVVGGNTHVSYDIDVLAGRIEILILGRNNWPYPTANTGATRRLIFIGGQSDDGVRAAALWLSGTYKQVAGALAGLSPDGRRVVGHWQDPDGTSHSVTIETRPDAKRGYRASVSIDGSVLWEQ